MVIKLKVIILCVAAIYLVSSCTKNVDYYRDNVTFPGYVAMEYTGNAIRNYSFVITKIFQFDEYISQTTIEKRDSIDMLYFGDIKIIRDEKENTWILRDIGFNEYSYMSINTRGKNINDDNAKWIISFYGNREYVDNSKAPEFEIEKIGDKHWHIKNHANHDYLFDYTSEWEIKLNEVGGVISLEGSGSLLSFESPKLKLDYTITTPVEAIYKNYHLSIPSGIIRILATDVDKGITEETTAEIISDNEIRITYKNNVENYNYSLSW